MDRETPMTLAPAFQEQLRDKCAEAAFGTGDDCDLAFE